MHSQKILSGVSGRNFRVTFMKLVSFAIKKLGRDKGDMDTVFKFSRKNSQKHVPITQKHLGHKNCKRVMYD